MTTIVQVENLRKTYGSKTAVADISFAVERGEIFGILGPNGAGKTTTVEALAGLREPDSGTLRVLGHDPLSDPAAVRQVLGVQLQESRLPARITVAEALALYAAFYPHPADVETLITDLGLGAHRRTAYADLSGGLQQRLSIALALVGNPQVVILDELTTGLDPQARRDVWEMVRGVRDRGVTVVLVTHFMDEAQTLCDRLVIIDGGRIVAAGAPGELVHGVDDTRTFRMLLPVPLERVRDELTALPEVHDVRPVGDEIEVRGGRRALPAVVIALAARDVVPDEIQTMTRTLDDVFVEVTGASPQSTEVPA